MDIVLSPEFLASIAGIVLSAFVAALVANQATYTLTR